MFSEVAIFFFEALTVLWFFCIGACFGSFLNVIVYRLPLGLNLSYPPSRCPYCETPILLKDNIPVLGWICLKGRCRQCSTSISIRYPFIEAVTAIMFVYLLFIEIASGGANIPVIQPSVYSGIRWNVWNFRSGLIYLYAYHIYFLYILLASVLIEFDHRKIPLFRLVIPSLILASLCPGFFPKLLPVPASQFFNESLSELNFGQPQFSFGPVFTSLIGLIAGAVTGTFFLISSQRFFKNKYPVDFPILYMLCGAFLGWQAVLSVALIQLILEFLIHVIGGFLIPILKIFSRPILLFGAVILQITYWRKLGFVSWWPGYDSSTLSLIAVCLFILLGIITNDWIRSRMNSMTLAETD